MNKEVLDYVVEKTHELIDAPTCSSEAREAAKAWLDALGTDAEGLRETKKYIDEPGGRYHADRHLDQFCRIRRWKSVLWRGRCQEYCGMPKRSRLPEPNTATARPA